MAQNFQTFNIIRTQKDRHSHSNVLLLWPPIFSAILDLLRIFTTNTYGKRGVLVQWPDRGDTHGYTQGNTQGDSPDKD